MGKMFCNNDFLVIHDDLCEEVNESVGSYFAYVVQSLDLGHARLGHMSVAAIKKL